ncbi:sugar ABC transporter ATP-binding protein [Parafrankia sp. EUN1f]|uniref:sugar ABC transporter ATP-binding protein n=1 Tax=Parafrankia sp. EUN1f TaxID=102897 RepID=UPI0001C46900|nr:sugar ABC transporter ATP-binding protein [Parafrankia sp. EUN1f]EFC80296.1 ABC transporter related protein [Parafrankia sp. EUN1f]
MPALEVVGISKRFGGQRALNDVSFTANRGEVHCLLGHNGSGKSTLIKVLAGFHQPDGDGRLLVDGASVPFGSPVEAHQHGLRFVHQDLALIEKLSVTDNLALGGTYIGKRWLSSRRENRGAEEVMRRLGITDVPVATPLARLSASQRAMTAIVRAVSQGGLPSVLVCDEPTASLSENEKERLFSLLRALRDRGVAIIYVTHRLHEVFQIGDHVTVLRDGRNVVDSLPVTSLDHGSLVAAILGREPEAFYTTPPAPSLEPVIEVEGLAGERVRDLSVTVHAGEIVGLVGLMGSGVEEALPLIFGAGATTAGEVRVRGRTLKPGHPDDAVDAGLVYVPGDRKRLGGFAHWPLSSNITVSSIPSVGPMKWLSRRRERASVLTYLTSFGVMPASPKAIFSTLSGGNQQKVVIARTQHSGATAVLVEDPTAGVDVGAKPAIYAALARIAGAGGAILLMTSDYEEASMICDRVIVLSAGLPVAWLSGDALTPDSILTASLRAHSDDGATADA